MLRAATGTGVGLASGLALASGVVLASCAVGTSSTPPAPSGTRTGPTSRGTVASTYDCGRLDLRRPAQRERSKHLYALGNRCIASALAVGQSARFTYVMRRAGQPIRIRFEVEGMNQLYITQTDPSGRVTAKECKGAQDLYQQGACSRQPG